MEKVPISFNTLNAITGYLGKCPYQEVAPLIDSLQHEVTLAKQVPVEEEKQDGATGDDDATADDTSEKKAK